MVGKKSWITGMIPKLMDNTPEKSNNNHRKKYVHLNKPIQTAKE